MNESFLSFKLFHSKDRDSLFIPGFYKSSFEIVWRFCFKFNLSMEAVIVPFRFNHENVTVVMLTISFEEHLT